MPAADDMSTADHSSSVETSVNPLVARDIVQRRLCAERRAASSRRDVALTGEIGFVEIACPAEPGWLWMIGWIIDEGAAIKSMLLEAAPPRPAGGAFVSFARDDLPPGGHGFVALVRCDWIPGEEAASRIVMRDNGQYLTIIDGLEIRGVRELSWYLRLRLGQATGIHVTALQAVLDTEFGWEPSDNDTADRVTVDDAALLPGFGLLINGWALSTTKEVDHLSLRIGDEIALAEPRSIIRFPRVDVAEAYPALGLATDRAGITALFRGSFDARNLSDTRLRLAWTDGSNSHAMVSQGRVRILGVTAPVADATHFYPAIEAEEFFVDFAQRVVALTRDTTRRITPFRLAPARRALVMAVSPASSDALLMFDDAMRHQHLLPDDWGLVFVAAIDRMRSLVVGRYHAIAEASGRPVSLVFTAGNRAARDVVAPICRLIGIEHAGFVADHVCLTTAGWRAIGGASDVTLLGVRDLTTGETTTSMAAAVARADRWDTVLSAPGARDEVPTDASVTTIDDAAVSLGAPIFAPFEHRLNAIIARRHD